MEFSTGTNDEINKHTLEEITHFTPLPVIRNILVTGGNGFLYAFTSISNLQSTHIKYFLIAAFKVPRADRQSIEVLGSFEPLPSPIKATIISCLSIS